MIEHIDDLRGMLDDEIMAEIIELRESLAGMLQSYDLLTGDRSPVAANPFALAVVEGFFGGEPARARRALGAMSE